MPTGGDTTSKFSIQQWRQEQTPPRDAVQAFIARFTQWSEWLPGNHVPETDSDCEVPTYALPIALIDRLAAECSAATNKRGTLISDFEFESEREYARLCNSTWSRAVGVFRGEPIVYDLLASDAARAFDLPSRDEVRFRGEWEAFREIVNEQESSCSERPGRFDSEALAQLESQARASMLDAVYTLRQTAEFAEDVALLHRKWLTLPTSRRAHAFGFHDHVERCLMAHEETVDSIDEEWMTPCDQPFGDFVLSYYDCVKKWSLLGFASWDLPILPPWCPYLSVARASELLPPDAQVSYRHPFFVAPEGAAARSLSQLIDRHLLSTHGKSIKPRTYAKRRIAGTASKNCLQMLLAERAITQRYGGRLGLSACFCRAVARWLDIEPSRVRNLRTEYRKRTRAPQPRLSR
jgi:hypothetical protein